MLQRRRLVCYIADNNLRRVSFRQRMTGGIPQARSCSVSQAQCESAVVTAPTDWDKLHRCPSIISTSCRYYLDFKSYLINGNLHVDS